MKIIIQNLSTVVMKYINMTIVMNLLIVKEKIYQYVQIYREGRRKEIR